eukprot:gnl/Dysnectes_brevis/2817_a3436_934.p1 GENE.gnl/Dysnectes_brevis/2817_a3436_934~~gnl/Dysnectes_brevis/2817_a3436_934.p1  ORF type:complete len:1197 (+),score=378.97 gnl/Dysnectes_brevis/2817_a3436_934:30-3620(+)
MSESSDVFSNFLDDSSDIAGSAEPKPKSDPFSPIEKKSKQESYSQSESEELFSNFLESTEDGPVSPSFSQLVKQDDSISELSEAHQSDPISIDISESEEEIKDTESFYLPPSCTKTWNKLYPHQQTGVKWLCHRAFAKGPHRGGILADDMGLGKAQPLDEPVLTPAGWSTMGEIRPGDAVVGSDGRPTTVTDVYPQGVRSVYRVSFSDGASCRCCEEHLWRVRVGEGDWVVRELRELMDMGLTAGGEGRFEVPLLTAAASELPDGLSGGYSISDRTQLMRRMCSGIPRNRDHIPLPVLPHQVESISELVRSVGGIASLAADQSVLQISHPIFGHSPSRHIVSVTTLAPVPCQCIRVEAADHMYVTKDYVLTHNTVQVASFLRIQMARKKLRYALVVVPKTLIDVWTTHIRTWCGAPTFSYHGNSDKRWQRLRLAMSQRCAVVITTYGTMSIDAEQLSSPRGVQTKKSRYSWDAMILDEATKIKNPAANTTKAAHTIPARLRLALTGTPVLNRLGELWSLVEWVRPGHLGTRGDFKRYYAQPIAKARLKDAMSYERRRGQEQLAQLQKVLEEIILRRTKDILKTKTDPGDGEDKAARPGQLGAKAELVMWVKPTALQLEIYNDILGNKSFKRDLQDALRAKLTPFSMITLLRKVCDHLSKLRDADLEYLSDGLPEKIVRAKSEALSSKIVLLIRLCQQFMGPKPRAPKHRVLIFSQHVTTLDLIERTLRANNMSLLRIDGDVSSAEERGSRVREFNRGRVFAMLLTHGVGGMGLTLTGADRVILFGPQWGPAAESQAVDRCHRIGQDKDVVVYRMVVAGMIEERMFCKQLHKNAIINATVDKTLLARLVTQSDVRHLFKEPPTPIVCETANILNRYTDPTEFLRSALGKETAEEQVELVKSLSAAGTILDVCAWKNVNQQEEDIAPVASQELRDLSGAEGLRRSLYSSYHSALPTISTLQQQRAEQDKLLSSGGALGSSGIMPTPLQGMSVIGRTPSFLNSTQQSTLLSHFSPLTLSTPSIVPAQQHSLRQSALGASGLSGVSMIHPTTSTVARVDPEVVNLLGEDDDDFQSQIKSLGRASPKPAVASLDSVVMQPVVLRSTRVTSPSKATPSNIDIIDIPSDSDDLYTTAHSHTMTATQSALPSRMIDVLSLSDSPPPDQSTFGLIRGRDDSGLDGSIQQQTPSERLANHSFPGTS